MIAFVVLLTLVVYILMKAPSSNRYSYKAFLLTIPSEKGRQERFKRSHNPHIPIEIIYGPDTRKVDEAKKYEEYVDPEYFEMALEMHYDKTIKRPDMTYFNLGAIGCFMGHMDFYKRCVRQGIKYAVIFEDNVIIKSNVLYDEIDKVIKQKGDDFEMCFFHCLSRLPDKMEGNLEKVKWISSTKCYLIHVDNMKSYTKYFFPMDNHVDMKHEDLIAQGARVYYKDMREYMFIDRTHKSLIGHSDHGRKNFFSRQHPMATPDDVIFGY